MIDDMGEKFIDLCMGYGFGLCPPSFVVGGARPQEFCAMFLGPDIKRVRISDYRDEYS